MQSTRLPRDSHNELDWFKLQNFTIKNIVHRRSIEQNLYPCLNSFYVKPVKQKMNICFGSSHIACKSPLSFSRCQGRPESSNRINPHRGIQWLALNNANALLFTRKHDRLITFTSWCHVMSCVPPLNPYTRLDCCELAAFISEIWPVGRSRFRFVEFKEQLHHAEHNIHETKLVVDWLIDSFQLMRSSSPKAPYTVG